MTLAASVTGRPELQRGGAAVAPRPSEWVEAHCDNDIAAGGLHWRVLRAGSGPCLLLLHGTGAAVHSWRGLAPLLAHHFSVVAPDLPGHGGSSSGPQGTLSLGGMSRALAALLRHLNVAPALVVGHSAGAAIAVRMVLDELVQPRELIALNGAFLPFGGAVGRLVTPLARLIAASEVVPRLLARRATDPRAVKRLLASTGSTVDADGVRAYADLLRSPEHIGATLKMMANWDLRPLQRELPTLAVPMHLVVGTHDGTVPASQASRVAARCRQARITRLARLGHLAHEEDPQQVADLIISDARDCGLL